jgi:uncharacterized DUF497 family protein
MKINWDPDKARKNLVKHNVAFEEASTVFGDPLSLTISDTIHSDREERFLTMGATSKFKLVVVAHTDQNELIRIISAREATGKEREKYEDGI